MTNLHRITLRVKVRSTDGQTIHRNASLTFSWTAFLSLTNASQQVIQHPVSWPDQGIDERRNNTKSAQRWRPFSRSNATTIQVAVCRTCYDVYRRLDKLRERASRATARGASLLRGSSSSSSLPSPSLKQQQGLLNSNLDVKVAAEASAVTLRADVSAMLQDVDARASKPRITEAGILWRRRLRFVRRCTRQSCIFSRDTDGPVHATLVAA